jgi:hypothetical protein
VGLWVPLAACFLLTPLPSPTAAAASIEDGADAIILEERMEIEIHSVTNATVRYSKKTKVLTTNGAKRYDSEAVGYSPSVRIRHLGGAVTTPPGKRIKTKKRDVHDGAAFPSFALYAESRYRAISFSGVVPGSIVEFSYEKTMSNLFYLPDFFDLQSGDPVRLRTLTVQAPSSFPLRLTVRGGDPQYHREENHGVVTHQWSVQNVPAVRLDRGTAPEADLVPRVLISPKQIEWGEVKIDTSTWDGVARFYSDLARDRMVPTVEVERSANILTANTHDPLEKTRLIFEFVQHKVNYVLISLGIGGWQPHNNGDVLEYLYGDCKDKATLMIAMLRAVGLRGWPVLIRTRDQGLIDRDNPFLSFNHAIVAVPSENGYLFMDPTSETEPFGDLPWVDQGVPVLVIKEDGRGDLVETPLFPAERNRRHIAVHGRITPAGALEGEVVIDASGQVRAYYAPLLEARAEDREEIFADLMAWLSPGARLESQQVEPPASPDDPLRVTGSLTIPGFVTRAGSIEIVSPHVARFPDLTWATAYSGRDHPFFFEYLFSNTVEARLQLPSGKTLKRVPKNHIIEGAGLKTETNYELLREGGMNILVVRRSLSVTRREIPTEEYDELYDFVAALAEEEARAVTLKPES